VILERLRCAGAAANIAFFHARLDDQNIARDVPDDDLAVIREATNPHHMLKAYTNRVLLLLALRQYGQFVGSILVEPPSNLVNRV
jgi:pheromone shutdown protein TraB